MQRVLVQQAMAGDLDAFIQLVKASAPRLKGVAYLNLRDEHRAEDALQDAFLLAWRDIRALCDADVWDAWLRRLTVRSARTDSSSRRDDRVERADLDGRVALMIPREHPRVRGDKVSTRDRESRRDRGAM